MVLSPRRIAASPWRALRATMCFCVVAASALSQEGVTFRVRVLKLKPEQPAMITWRYGGEGLGGKVVSGVVTYRKPEAPKAAAGGIRADDELENFSLEDKAHDKERIVIEGDTIDYVYLYPKVWSDPSPITMFGAEGRHFITFGASGLKSEYNLTDCEIEFEVSHQKKVIKQFTVAGPDGPTFGVVIPCNRLDKGKPTDVFLRELGSLRNWAQLKIDSLKEEPYMDRPVPKRYALTTTCSGYGTGYGYGRRTTDRDTMLAEFEVLRLIGVNGTVSAPEFVDEMIKRKEGIGAGLTTARHVHTIGYPIAMIDVADGRKPFRHPGDGCPYHPDNLAGITNSVREAVRALAATARNSGVDAVWARTVDEIGTVFGGAPEGKAHQGCCPYCQEAFRKLIREDGRQLVDFGAPSWDDIRSTSGYWAINYWESLQMVLKRIEDAENAVKMGAEAGSAGTGVMAGKGDADDPIADKLFAETEGAPKKDPAQELLDARAQLHALEWNGQILSVPKDKQQHRLSAEGWHLLEYYSREFNSISSAILFEPLQKGIHALNEEKQLALARGEKNTPAAEQAWVYSFALRGNTFLMGGHSLGFFDFYRHADNAMVYETSNRDRRVWQWDSYLCDVGRSLHRFMGKEFGIYVKPHRGAPVQRALTAMSRGVRMIYWYTYGPEWQKGDTFGGNHDLLKKIAWTSRLMGEAEHVTYDSEWAIPAEVAVVRPRTGEFFSGSASWENGKWVFMALTHAHIPVDALDEWLLRNRDLSQYKVIVVSGSHIRRDVAEKLKTWVQNGGTLLTTGWGMAKDEAGRDLDTLWPVFGVSKRGGAEIWGSVPGYGATSLGAVTQTRTPPEGAAVAGRGPLRGSFTPVVGREVLSPVAGAETAANYADGSAAVVKNKFGKGTAWLVGTYAGVEYAWETMQNKPYDDDKRTFLSGPVTDAGVRPVVDADHPLVEGVLLRNTGTGKLAVVLMNWAFQIDREVTVRLRGAERATKARSLASQSSVDLVVRDGVAQLTLPGMAEGDILLLE